MSSRASTLVAADLGRPRVMGVVNVTPDSFSDGGRFMATDAAIAHGLALLDLGADLIDVGGESTRPGATRPVVSEELDRVVPVIAALAEAGAAISVDTMRAEVAQAAVDAGALVVNDVSGGLADPRILDVVASADVAYVLMHWRAHSTEMQEHTSYAAGVVAGVRAELSSRVDEALARGVDPTRLVLDPGLGFSKTYAQNWDLVRHLDQVTVGSLPILVGASRKSFLGHLLADDAGPRPVPQREFAHNALITLLAHHGVWGLRVHDVRACRDALAVVTQWQDGTEP
ncbi:dihydropteroate synthase [Nocardioides sp. Bht2]|uniref:dihydropteroate synthase n=1 Tax=Nocardioides sp. Bht2 TaxID=3392297 RepID=UPI0039B4CFCD